MAESKSMYYGPQNRGLATVLPTEAPNLFQVMDDLQAQRQAKEAEDAKRRGEEIAKAMEYNPDEVWQPYTEYSQKLYEDEYLSQATKMYSNGRIPTQEEKFDLERRKQKINSQINRINGFREAETEFLKEVNKNPDMYDVSYITEYVGTLHKNVEGGLLDPSELDISMIDNIKGDHKAIREDYALDSFDEMLAEETKADVESTSMGYLETKTSQKSGIEYELDSEGRIAIDPETGNRKFKVSDAVFEKAMAFPIAKMKVQAVKDQSLANGEDISMREAFKRWYEPRTYIKEQKNRENNQFAINAHKEKLRGKDTEDSANIFFRDVDTLLSSPKQDETKSIEWYISENGNPNKEVNGRPLIPVVSVFDGRKIGDIMNEDGKKQEVNIAETFHDPETGNLYYREDGKEELTPLDRYTSATLVEKIIHENPNFKGYIKYGEQNGWLTRTNEGKNYFNRKVKNNDVIKRENEIAKQQQQKITLGIEDFNTKMTDALNTMSQAREGKSFYNIGYKEEEVNSMNEILSNIPKGVTVKIDGETYEDPEIKLEYGTFKTLGGYKFVVDGKEVNMIADKEGFNKLMKSITPSREITSTKKETNSTSNTEIDPLGIL